MRAISRRFRRPWAPAPLACPVVPRFPAGWHPRPLVPTARWDFLIPEGSPGGCLSDERQLSPALDITLRSVSAALCTTRRAARTRKSFKLVLTGAELKVCKYREAMEYTMPAQHYLDSMKINNRIIRFAGEAFYVVKWLSRNKIMALVSRAP
jgi:hypothetical protein